MSDYEYTLVGIILTGIFIFSLFYLLQASRHFDSGYMTCRDHGTRGIRKTYNETKVSFYSWGSSDVTADGNDSYLGIYCIIHSPKDLSDGLRKYFDEAQSEEHQGRYILTLKKRGLYIGSREMKDFLRKIDPVLRSLI